MSTVTLAGRLVRETEDAYLFDDGDREVWLPRSECEWDPDARELTLPEWLAVDRELV